MSGEQECDVYFDFLTVSIQIDVKGINGGDEVTVNNIDCRERKEIS